MARNASQLDIQEFAQRVRTSEGFALRKVALAVTRLYDRMLATAGLGVTEFGILRVCGQFGSIDVSGLARELVTDGSTVVRNLKPLVADGMLTQHPPGGSEVTIVVELTPRGRKVLSKGIAQWEHAQRELISQVGEERWKRLRSELSAIETLSQLIPPH